MERIHKAHILNVILILSGLIIFPLLASFLIPILNFFGFVISIVVTFTIIITAMLINYKLNIKPREIQTENKALIIGAVFFIVLAISLRGFGIVIMKRAPIKVPRIFQKKTDQ